MKDTDKYERKVDTAIIPELQKCFEPLFGKLKLRKTTGDGVYTSYYFKTGRKNITITIQDDLE
jgi:hypothetical protein